MCKTLENPLKGKVVVVRVENDQRLPVSVSYYNFALAVRLSREVYPIIFRSPKSDAHFDRYFNYPETRRTLIRCFKTSPRALPLEKPENPQIYYKSLLFVTLISIVSLYILKRMTDSGC